jgi:3-phosphoshikimate 1-carboxyvinyltransferase
MGCSWRQTSEGLVFRGGRLKGAELDLNATPDALPALSVAACFAEGRTVLGNVPQARQKETDRIAVMHRELARLGASVEELPDGLVVRGGGGLRGGAASGHGDHRVVMALAVAGLASERPVEVDTAEAVAITFPDFVELMTSLGADVQRAES